MCAKIAFFVHKDDESKYVKVHVFLEFQRDISNIFRLRAFFKEDGRDHVFYSIIEHIIYVVFWFFNLVI
jgi:hypothetical protein